MILEIEKYVFNFLTEKLSPKLFYHNLAHTKRVYSTCKVLSKFYNLSKKDNELLLIAALFHDTGFVNTTVNHEEVSCLLASNFLAKKGISDVDIGIIQSIIMATKIPQSPLNELEKMLCDADLEYLGSDDFYSISNKLYFELFEQKKIESIDEWNVLQIKFFKNHYYYTDYAISNFEPKKLYHLYSLINK